MSLKRIAQMVGVSPSTVSRVLAGQNCASQPVRDAIFRAAQQLGYQPNQAARQLRSGGGPVSYTHLDVYKRQPLDPRQGDAPLEPPTSLARRCGNGLRRRGGDRRCAGWRRKEKARRGRSARSLL